MLLTLGRVAPLFLRNKSHLVGVGDLMDSACEQDDTKQVFPKLAAHGNGRSVDAELDARSRRTSISLNSPPLQTCRVFWGGGGRSLAFGECPFHHVNGSLQFSTPSRRIPPRCLGQYFVSPCIPLLSVGGPLGLPELSPLPVKPPRRQRGLAKPPAEPSALFLLRVALLKRTHWKILKHPLRL